MSLGGISTTFGRMYEQVTVIFFVNKPTFFALESVDVYEQVTSVQSNQTLFDAPTVRWKGTPDPGVS